VNFSERLQALPVLGIGLSTEYGAAASPGALDPLALHRAHPELAAFLEIGVETAKGLDPAAASWVGAGLPTTYHFLDINLDEPEDMDEAWLGKVKALCARTQPAWMCGDAGLWHLGRRERGHMLLLPPILTDEGATALAAGIVRLREATGLEVLPENPPGAAYIGDLDLLDFFGRVSERADTGLLLDCAHLAIYQRMMGRNPTDGLDDFPLDRVVEIHVAGGTERDAHGFAWVEDDHTTDVLPDTWAILERVAAGAKNLRAVVFECERNGADDVMPGFQAIQDRIRHTPAGGAQ
jgi:uncharacterized protein (UPF0276 family)